MATDMASAPQTLEQQLINLTERHNLTSLSITVYRGDDRLPRFGASAQGGGKCEFNAFGTADTVSARIASAIEQLSAARAVPTAVSTLAPIAEAA